MIPSEPSLPQPGDTLAGKYRVDGVLQHGGMSLVVAATHMDLGQRVAVKILNLQGADAQQASARFLREARAASGLCKRNPLGIRQFLLIRGTTRLWRQLPRLVVGSPRSGSMRGRSPRFNASGMPIPLILGQHAEEIAADTATLTVQFDPTHTRVLSSTFGGVLSDAAVEAFLTPPFLIVTECDADMASSLLTTTVLPNADLVAGYPNFVAPQQTCDRMSIGLGIEWRPVVEPTRVVEVPSAKQDCDDEEM